MIQPPTVVALGGGHGLAASLSALRHLTENLTAVVTVADNGGSSGRLRNELGVLPPGDLRMALSALCQDSQWGRTWSALLQHRFTSEGPLDGHAVGNLLISALWELLGDPVSGLDWVGKLLDSRGRVLPMAMVPMEIEADVVMPTGETKVVQGQAQVATSPGRVTRLRLLPEDAPACPEAVNAVLEADWVILGPGSWYTSLMPHLYVKELREALVNGRGRVCLTLNLVSQTETSGLTPGALLRDLHHTAPELNLSVVLADPRAIDDLDDFVDGAALLGAQVVLRQVSSVTRPDRHDSLRLAAAFRDVFDKVFDETTPEPGR